MGKKRIVRKASDARIVPGKTMMRARSLPERGIVYIFSSYNNTLITLTDENGAKLLGSSAGAVGFFGSKKGTPYAASQAAGLVADLAREGGMKAVAIRVRGVGTGRESAIRTFLSKGFDVDSIKDITPIPHGHRRLPKPRRV